MIYHNGRYGCHICNSAMLSCNQACLGKTDGNLLYVKWCRIVGSTKKMEKDFKFPEYLFLQGNPSENWRRWIQLFELYVAAKEMTKTYKSRSIFYFVHNFSTTYP